MLASRLLTPRRPITQASPRGLAAERFAVGGFTVIELLVVISIIVLLIALLLPAFGRAREWGRITLCRSNLRQQMFALTAYVNDNDGYMPGAHTHGAAPEGSMIWMPRTREYAGDAEKVYNCPTADPDYYWKKTFGSGLPARYGYEANENRIRNGNGRFTYGINDWGVNEFTNPHLGLGNHIDNGGSPSYEWGEIRLVRVRNPSNCTGIGGPTADRIWDRVIHPDDNPGFLAEAPGNRHLDGLNIVFMDGHADWMLQEDALLRPGDSGDTGRASMWNNDGQPHQNEWLPYVPG